MRLTPSKYLWAIVLTGTLTFSGARLAAAPQDAQQNQAQPQAGAQPGGAQPGQKQFKDRAEYDMYVAITGDQNPTTKLQKLNDWKQKYPTTDFEKERRTLYLTTYAGLGQIENALNTAGEILQTDPNDFTSLYYTALLTSQVPGATGKPATPEQLDRAEKAANALVGGALDKQFAADKKPANMNEADWKKARTDIEAISHTTLGWVAMQRQNNDAAEGEFGKSLALNPNNGEVDYWMGQVIAAEKKPEKRSLAFYYFGRAAAYDGAGSLSAAGRKQVMDYLSNAYKTYHGSTEGLDQLLAQAKANPNPPPNFTIVSARELAEAKLKAEQEEAAKNPQLTLWKNIKTELTGANGAQYFQSSMKGAQLPAMSGKVISLEPAVRPRVIVLGIENASTPDATLKFETPLPGKVEPGTVLTFEGVPDSYTTSPFMVTFNVDRKNLRGWPAAAPAPAHRAPARRTTRRR